MVNPTQLKLKRLVLSATELRNLHPEWSDAMIEDYLNIWDDLVTLANSIDDTLTEGNADNIATLIGDGYLKDSGIGISQVILKKTGSTPGNLSIFDSDGDLQDSGNNIPEIEKRSTRLAYFYARAY